MLGITIYVGLSTTERPYNEQLVHAQMASYSTQFGGGLYGTFELFLAAPATADYQWRGGDRLVIRDGLVIVWEGVLLTINRTIRNEETGLVISCAGAQSRLAKIMIDRRWADQRLDESVWVVDTAATMAEKARLDRQGRIRITPGEEEYTYAEYTRSEYTMPTGRTIKRVTATSQLSETATWSPSACKNNALTDLPNAIDGIPLLSATVSLNAGQYFYVGAKRPFSQLTFDFGSPVNANTATMSAEYVNTSDVWTALTISSDGTATGGKTWAQDGIMKWTMPTDWEEAGLVGSTRCYWVRLTPSANLTANISITEITAGQSQAWHLRLRDLTSPIDIFAINADATTAHDVTLGTPRQSLALEFLAMAKQTGFSNGSVFGQVVDLTVYDDTTAPTVSKIAADAIDEASAILNSDETQIGSNSYDLTPFLTNGPEPLTNILDRAAAFGDASQNAWYWTLVDSETAVTPNGKPVLKLAQVPDLTDYEYVVSLDDNNLLPPFEIVVDYEAIVNYVMVIYTDPDTGRETVITPDDESTLKDTTSIEYYGERHGTPIRLGQTSAAAALNYGRRFLAEKKSPQYSVSGPVRVMGGIRTAAGGWVPAAQINADGTRIKIENFMDDVTDVGENGLTFRVAATRYNPATNICDISTGQYDDLAVLLARLQ